VSDPEEAAPWREPAVGAYWSASDRSLSGVELLRGEVDGRIPSPIGHLTGLRAMDGAVGAATFSMPATPWLVGSQGLIAGGTLAILADSPLAAAIGSSLPPETGLASVPFS
jgi:acyl-coenzyme A thioesterase PaaI-like protein